MTQIQHPETQQEPYRLMVEHFFADLSCVENIEPLLLLIDEFEKGDMRLREWISEQFLPGIPADLPLIAVVAGQRTPDLSYGEKWVKHLVLERLPFECWTQYLQQQGICQPESRLRRLYDDPASGGGGLPIALSIITRVLQMESVEKW